MENSKLSCRTLGAIAATLIGWYVGGCSNVATNLTPDLNNPVGGTAIVLGGSFTDPNGTLSVLPITPPRTPTVNVQTTHSDAVVRAFQGKLYVVNRLGADNIEVIDPAQAFKVTEQFSVGQGTNPQDIIVSAPHRAFVTLYQPADNKSADLTVGDFLIVDPETGTILKTIDLTPFTADDGDRFARASQMVIVNDKIFIVVQDLPSDLSLPPDQPGKLVVFDRTKEEITGSVILQGRDPVNLTYSPETNLIYVSDADYFDINSPYGGIEAVDPTTLKSQGILIDDLLLGGAPGDIEVGRGRGFVTVGYFDANTGNFATKVSAFDLIAKAPTPQDLYGSQGYIQDIAVDQNGDLLVGDRDPNVNGVVFLNPKTGSVTDGPINTGAAPASITFIE